MYLDKIKGYRKVKSFLAQGYFARLSLRTEQWKGAQTDMQYFITVYLWLKVPFWKTFNRLIFNGDIINDSCGIELHLPLFR